MVVTDEYAPSLVGTRGVFGVSCVFRVVEARVAYALDAPALPAALPRRNEVEQVGRVLLCCPLCGVTVRP